jgi:dihydrofolate reductase
MSARVRPRLSLIAAVARNGVIGSENRLPWRLPADLKRFRMLTMGHPIIMGRKTFASLGRPLPGRDNIVLTRDPAYRAAGCHVVHSLEEAISVCEAAEQAFVIGGADLYALALPLVSTLYMTELDIDGEGDTRFPDFDRSQFVEAHREHHTTDESNPFDYDFVVYERRVQPLSVPIRK